MRVPAGEDPTTGAPTTRSRMHASARRAGPGPAGRPGRGRVAAGFRSGLAGAGRGLLALLVAIALAAGTFAMVDRPAANRWGASTSEAAAPMPGDALVPHAASVTTRAVNIRAPVSDVWAWLVQFGAGRGGLYSYDMAERLVGVDVRNAEVIVPALQKLAVGDTIWVTPRGYPANLVFKVAAIQPEAVLVLALTKHPDAGAVPAVSDWSWAFQLRATGPGTTRLLSRQRTASLGGTIADAIQGGVVGPVGFAMERKTLLGIKQRAEALAGMVPGAAGDGPLFALLALGAAGAVALGMARRLPVWARLGAAGAAAIVLEQVLFRWYPHAGAAALADLAIGVGIVVSYGVLPARVPARWQQSRSVPAAI